MGWPKSLRSQILRRLRASLNTLAGHLKLGPLKVRENESISSTEPAGSIKKGSNVFKVELMVRFLIRDALGIR